MLQVELFHLHFCITKKGASGQMDGDPYSTTYPAAVRSFRFFS